VKDHSDVVQKAYNLLVTEGLIQLWDSEENTITIIIK
jgi:hypothetical protein